MFEAYHEKRRCGKINLPQRLAGPQAALITA